MSSYDFDLKVRNKNPTIFGQAKPIALGFVLLLTVVIFIRDFESIKSFLFE